MKQFEKLSYYQVIQLSFDSIDVTMRTTVQTGRTKRTAQHARQVNVTMMSSCVRSEDASQTHGSVTVRQTAKMGQTKLTAVSIFQLFLFLQGNWDKG